jgi:hypothetical protein
MTQKTLQQSFLILIITLYLVIAGAYAIYTPDWQSPDEPAHYNYIRQVAEDHIIPTIEPGDWDQNYLDRLKSNHFASELLTDLAAIQYEDHQPPLYYLLATPVYWLTDGNLTALRLFSVLIGTLIVVSAYATGNLMFPNRPWIGLGAAAFVAFLPQHVHILASVNNDALGWAVVGVTLLFTTAYVKDEPLRGRDIKPWQLGLLVGIGLITKTTTYFMAGVVPVAIILRWWTIRSQDIRETSEFTFPEEAKSSAHDFNDITHRLTLFLIPVLIMGGIWWLRNIAVYDFPDFLGLAEHDAVVTGQPRTAERIDLIGFNRYIKEISQTTFNSFWGQFGWMAVPMPSRVYMLLRFFMIVALSGLITDIYFRRHEVERITTEQRNTRILMGMVAFFSMLAYAFYNLEFQQYQGRYMFTLLIPLSIWFTLGLDAWRRILTGGVIEDRSINAYGKWRWLWDCLPYFGVAILMVFPLLDIYLLWRVIVPNL